MGFAITDIHLRLVDAVPEFRGVVDEHLSFNEELLPHVLFGDLTRFVIQAHNEGNHAIVGRSLQFLDAALRSGDPEVRNLVAVSFVENVGPWDDEMRPFISTWPVALRQEARSRDLG